jgi:hypothetical protein
MDDKERQSFHDEANKIARDASIRIKVLEGKARNTEKNAMLIPPGTPDPLRDLPPRYQSYYFREAAKEKMAALRDIEEAIGRMPPHATDRDKGLVRGQAYEELGGREKILREKAQWLQGRGNAPLASHPRATAKEIPGNFFDTTISRDFNASAAKGIAEPERAEEYRSTDKLKGSKFLAKMPQKEAATKDAPEQGPVQPSRMSDKFKGAQALAGRTQDADRSQEHSRTPANEPMSGRLKSSKFLSPEHQADLEKARQNKARGLDRER